MKCANCDKTRSKSFIMTAYGEILCEDCWDNYICTEAGMLEYLIGIYKGELPIEEFDADFLCSVAKSWLANNEALDLTDEKRAEIEDKVKELGIL